MATSQAAINRPVIGEVAGRSANDRADWAEAVPIAAGLYPDRRREFQPREIIYREGDEVDWLLQVRAGLIKLQRSLPGGRDRILRLCATGDLLGAEGLLDQNARYTAVAVGRTVVDSTRISAIKRAERQYPQRSLQIFRVAVEQLLRSDRWLCDYSAGGIRARVARLIDYLSTCDHAESSRPVHRLPVGVMADILGVSVEDVSRAIAGLQRRGALTRADLARPGELEIDYSLLHREAGE